VTGEDADLAHVGIEETPEHRVTEGAGAPGDHQYLVVEHRTFLNVNAARGLNEPSLSLSGKDRKEHEKAGKRPDCATIRAARAYGAPARPSPAPHSRWPPGSASPPANGRSPMHHPDESR